MDNDATWPATTNRGENSKSVVVANSGVGSDTILQDVIVSNGESFDDGNSGAGILVDNASPQIINCIIRHNRVGTYAFGGGSYVINESSSPVFTSCTIVENQRGTGGGMTVAYSAEARVESSQILTNVCDGQGGGGIAVERNSAITVVNSTIAENIYDPVNGTIDGGGGIVARVTGVAFLRGCVLANNVSNDAEGGGAWVGDNSRLTAVSCTFDGNQSLVGSSDGGQGGGAYSESGATDALRIVSCTFTNNVTDGTDGSNGGGGVYYSGPYGYVVNSLFYGNTGYNGGAIHTIGGDVKINNCTVSQNTAGNLGGGLYVFRTGIALAPGQLATVSNSIIWDNSATSGTTLEQKQFWTNRLGVDHAALRYSDIQNIQTAGPLIGFSNISSDPLFRNAATQDFHLAHCSPWDPLESTCRHASLSIL